MAREKLDLTPEDLKQIETLAGLGLNVTQMAAVLGMSKATFDRRMADTPGAIESLEKGRSLAASQVMKTAYTLAISGKVPAMTMFWLKCRERWKEVTAHEHTGKDGGPIESRDVSALTDEQLKEKHAAFLAKLAAATPGGEGT